MNITTTSLYNLTSAEVEFSACEDTVKIKVPDHDEGFGIIVKNNATTDGTVTIKGGNSVLAMGDMAVDVKKGSETLINLKDTGRFKNVHGEDAGYIVLNISGVASSSIELFAFGL
ncbi:MAG: hypothetical protein IKZ35_05330 [Clostridia bacterium]|nr:hypothetical protein [Clostridia bacterium]